MKISKHAAWFLLAAALSPLGVQAADGKPASAGGAVASPVKVASPGNISHRAPTATRPAQGGTAVSPGVQDLPLPGLGVLPGDRHPEREDNVVRITSNRTEVVEVSGTLMNRIATPFADPKAIFLEGSATVKAEGQSLYVSLDGTPNAFSLYVTGSGPNDPVVSLTMVPKAIPAQTIVLQMDGIEKTSVGAAGGRSDNPNSGVYTEAIVGILRTIALGKVPDGFVAGRLPLAAANLGQFTAIPMSRFSGSAYDVYRYRLVTESTTTIELVEEAFAAQGVRAVAFYPTALITKDAPTEVFVVADKKATLAGGQ